MSPLRGARLPARLLQGLVVSGTVAAVAVGPAMAVASAEEPAGTTVVGRLVQAVAESEHHDDAHTAHTESLTWVETAAGAVPVASDDVAGVPSGSTVTLNVDGDVDGADGDGADGDATGTDGGEPLPVLDTEEVVPPTPAAVLPGPVTNEVTVVLVAPAGTAPDAGVTPDQIAELVRVPVAEFWSTQTDGAVRVGVGSAHDWIATAAGCADPRGLWDEAAAAVGFRPGPGKHLLLRLSSQTAAQAGCSYALAEVGTGPGSGGRLYVREQLASVIAHELGHNFGLNHSSAVQCDGAVETGSCRTAAYRDLYDVMGASWRELGSLNAPQAARLGVLPADRTVHLGVGGAATSVALASVSAPTGVRAARLTAADGTDYWLEYRTATGQDAWLGGAANRYRLDSGVLLRRSASFPDSSVLLDGTPGAAAGWETDFQAALPVGVPIPLAGGDFTVTVSAQADGAVLEVVPRTSTTAEGAPAAAGSAAPRDNGAGRLQASTGRPGPGPVSPADGAATAPAAVDPRTVPWFTTSEAAVVDSPMLEPLGRSTSSGGLVTAMTVAVAGAALAGTTLLLVRRARLRVR
ncbi:reprolysin-like metallopeptidase [Blastococcus sp. CCUG 61487]|uniref:reprolysin-like metallopeptidase n=1 Tax=Blastococcus sp. CCUG 61487 TaxID=1840703 RepID=UPI0010C13B4A|nr:M66 family metalloprotease [Blastococcus sp. CCUG 61487]TKJ35628.1 hypothetical protein A6V29_14030 [Blastococcus sp. CCUG 61487]